MTNQHRLFPLLLVCAAAIAASAAPAMSDSGYVAPLEEIPLTFPVATGARSIGMGGVAVAVADDATAVSCNPAGLARLRRIELSASFKRASTDVTGVMSGSGFETALSQTDLSALRAAYPFPTFRGSLVMGFAAEQLYDFTGDRLAKYEGTIEWDEDGDGEFDSEGNWGQREDYLSDGGLTAWTFGGAADVSPQIALGAALTYVTGDYSYDFQWDLTDVDDVSETYSDVTLLEQYAADATGFRGTLGAIFYASDQLSLGMAIDTPVKITFEGSERIYVLKEGENPSDSELSDETALFTDEITLPFAFRAGVAYSPTDLLLLAADIDYTDWSEMDYFGRITETTEDDGVLARRSLYDEALGYAVGVEVILPSWPLRLRGGYSSRPLAYQGLAVDSDRSCFTLGAGLLIDTVLALDVAWVKSSYERSDEEYAFEESVTDEALVLEAAYRF